MSDEFVSVRNRLRSFQDVEPKQEKTDSVRSNEDHSEPHLSVRDRMKCFDGNSQVSHNRSSSNSSQQPPQSQPQQQNQNQKEEAEFQSIRSRLRSFEQGAAVDSNNNQYSNSNGQTQSGQRSTHGHLLSSPSSYHRTANKSTTGSNKPNQVPGSAAEYVQRILDGDESVAWGVFKWDKNTLVLVESGNSEFEEMKTRLDEAAVLFAYMRIPIGSDRRNKYVLIKWIGGNVRPIQRARAFDDCRRVQETIKVFHIELAANKRAELVEKAVIERLQNAAGANYDKEQNTANFSAQSNSEFGVYKRTSKQFFEQVERSGNLNRVVYETKPLAKQTPVDLGNRSMTAGASAARANTVDLMIRRNELEA